MAQNVSNTTTDHETIRRWVEERGGWPAQVASTARGDETGIIRVDFPGFSGEGKLERISWDDWFQKFDGSGLAFVYEDETAGGQRSNFNKLVSRETATARARGGRTSRRTPGRGGASRRGAKAASRTRAGGAASARKTSRSTQRKTAAATAKRTGRGASAGARKGARALGQAARTVSKAGGRSRGGKRASGTSARGGGRRGTRSR